MSRTTTVTLSTAAQGAVANLSRLYNAASSVPEGTCSSGSLATLEGSGFVDQSEGVRQASTLPWPTQLAGARITINESNAPIFAASNTAIQFQCPNLPAGTEISLAVKPADGGPSDPLQFTLHEATPGLFMLDQTNQGLVMIHGTDLVAGSSAGSYANRPARKGEYLEIYATGLGPLQEAIPAGSPAPADRLIPTLDRVSVMIGDVEVTPSFAGAAPGSVGLNQVSVPLSNDVPSGSAVPVYLKIALSDGTIVNSNAVTVAIEDGGQK
jgi:uncharacterized protein (TIGR03437 family)